jgi:hypothetical protein
MMKVVPPPAGGCLQQVFRQVREIPLAVFSYFSYMDRAFTGTCQRLTFFVLAVLLFSCTEKEILRADSDEEWSFVVFSDLQQGYGVYGILSGIIGSLEPSPVAAVCCGDIMLRPGNEAEWATFSRYSEPITDKMPLYIARGNHEGNDPESEALLHDMAGISGDHFYYSCRHRDACFLILDTQVREEEDAITGEQLYWLRQQLDAAAADSALNHVFVFMHHPLFPQGPNKGNDLLNAGELHQIFLQNNKIRAVFAGHDHLFNHYLKDGLHYITTGGGGGVLCHGYGGDYHHFTRVSFYKHSGAINIKTIGVFHETIENFDL